MITVTEQIADDDGWVFHVAIKEGSSTTEHTVSLPKSYYQTFTGGKKINPDILIRKSFEFLLEHEPKESILRSFALSDIEKYFPEFGPGIIK